MCAKSGNPGNTSMYVCPKCRRGLAAREQALRCPKCLGVYPIVEGIPDFLPADLSQHPNQILRNIAAVDRLARVYESWFWYPTVLNLFAGLGKITFNQIVAAISAKIKDIHGQIIDIACGPGTFGRRLASASRTIHGIDISMGMLRAGAAYVERDQSPNVQFARAQAEELPFRDRYFDAAACCGSLHLFPDTSRVLREIGRTMKNGAPLAVMTFAAGDAGILRYRRIREHVRRDHGLHIFELDELENLLGETGFRLFKPELYGSLLIFTAHKTSK